MLSQEPAANNQRGAILNMSTTLTRFPEPTHFATHGYAASKGAIESFSRAMAAYYAPHGIRVNVIAPGLVATPMSQRAQQNPQILAYAEARQPLSHGILEPSDLTDAEWALVRPLVETYATLTKDRREMVNGCLYLVAEGCRWRSLPKDFGPWQTIRGYWDRFHRDGVWADLAALLTPTARARLGRNPTPSTGIVDSQSVPSGPQKGTRGIDANKKVKGIKMP